MKHDKQTENFTAPHRLDKDNKLEFWNQYMELWVYCDLSCTVEDCKRDDALVSYDETWAEPFEGMDD